MATTLAFEIDDTSPTLTYSPLGDTFSTPDLSAGWNPYFTNSSFAQFPGQVGQGDSLHITSRNGSSLSIPFSGTKVQLFGNVTGDAFFSFSLNNGPAQFIATNSDGALASLSNLPNDQHVISLTASTSGAPDSFVVFDKAIIDTTVETTDTVSQSPIPDSDISFMGQWSFDESSNQPAHASQHAGDSLSLDFKGASIFVLGWISPQSGNYSVTLDDVTRNFSARSSFTQRNALLFHGTGLDPNATHRLQMSNLNDTLLALNLDGFRIHTLNSSSSSEPVATGANRSYPTGTIAALVLAGVLACLILSALLFYAFIYRPRKRRKARHFVDPIPPRSPGPDNKVSPDEGIASIVPPPPEGGRRASGRSFARWKREAETGYGDPDLGITFRHSDDDKSSAQKKSSRSSASRKSILSMSSWASSWRWRDRSRHKPSPGSFLLDLPAGTSHPYSRASSTQSLSSFQAPAHPFDNSDSDSTRRASAQGAAQHHRDYNGSRDGGVIKVLSPSPQMARPILMEIPPRHAPFDENDLGSVRENSRRYRPSVDQIAIRSLSPQLTSDYARDIARRSGSPLQNYKGKKDKRKEPSALRNASTQPPEPSSSALAGSSRRFSDVSRVRFEDDTPSSQQSSLKQQQQSDEQPSSGPTGRSSFLDFERLSARSQRASDSSLASQGPPSLAPPSHVPRSRWSSTTAAQTSDELSETTSSERPSERSLPPLPQNSQSNSSVSFPFPITIPLSPALSDIAPRRNSAVSQGTQVSSELGSVPQTISEIDFRHSDSEDSEIAQEHKALPAHPALPATPQSSSFILNRVLGHDRNASSTSYRTRNSPLNPTLR